jgi:hypothetical protein
LIFWSIRHRVLTLIRRLFFQSLCTLDFIVPMPTLPASEPASCQCPCKEPAKWTMMNVAAHPPVLNRRSFGSVETATASGLSRMRAAAAAASLWIGQKR